MKVDQNTLFYENTDLNDIKGEVWESAFGLDGLYEVSNKGRIKSLGKTVLCSNGKTIKFPKKIIRQCKIKHGNTFTLYVRLALDIKKYKNFTVASLILNSFRKPNQYNNVIHHINYCSYDNRIENLTFEKMHNKRQMEYCNGIRNGEKCVKHYRENGFPLNNMKLLSNLPPRKYNKTFQIASKKWPITIWLRDKNEVQTYSSVKNASELTGIKEYSIRNALARPHKYKRFIIKKGILNLENFFEENGCNL